MKIIYLLCEDDFGQIYDFGRFQAPLHEDNSMVSAMKRLSLNMLIIQCFVAQTLPNHKTFNMELDENNFPIVNIFKLKLSNIKIWCLEPNLLWEYVAQQLMRSQLANQDYKYVAFCSFTRYSSDEHKSKSTVWDINNSVKGHISLGGGGLALLGSAYLYTWPQQLNQIVHRFSDNTMIDSNNFMNDSAKRFVWSCYSTTLGACVHEIGHILDLGHSSTNGIMAKDFNNIHSFFTIKSMNSKQIKWWLCSEINILSHHKWIQDNNYQSDSTSDVLYLTNNIIKSKYGIVVIEYRDSINNNVLFSDSFTLPAKIVKVKMKQISNNMEMFAIDVFGNIIKSQLK